MATVPIRTVSGKVIKDPLVLAVPENHLWKAFLPKTLVTPEKHVKLWIKRQSLANCYILFWLYFSRDTIFGTKSSFHCRRFISDLLTLPGSRRESSPPPFFFKLNKLGTYSRDMSKHVTKVCFQPPKDTATKSTSLKASCSFIFFLPILASGKVALLSYESFFLQNISLGSTC